MRYGKAAFQNGWVGIRADPDAHPLNAHEMIAEEFNRIAGEIKFTFYETVKWSTLLAIVRRIYNI